MNMRKFLSTVWPSSGPYCIATPWIKPDGEECYAHRGCDTIQDAIEYILVKDNEKKDVYFAPHALKVIRELNPKTGKLQTFRTHENMREARSFFFDLDVGVDPEKPKLHSTQAAALGELERFLFATCLPSPFVVSSGYGVHVYWIIDACINSLAWREPAARLYWLAQQLKLYVDPSRTTDQSSVLRVPGTHNYKDPAAPRKVEILSEGVVTPTQDFLDQLMQLTSSYTPIARQPGKRARKAEESFPLSWDGRTPPADEVADVCEHMRVFRDTKGNIPEPLWHQGVGTIKHCDDGVATVHAWSSGYPRYTEVETQNKIDNWKVPPPDCETISEKAGDPAVCARCQYRNLAKNPVLIANVVYERTHQPAPSTVSHDVTPLYPPPKGYTLDAVHGVNQKGEGVICSRPMFPVAFVKATLNETTISRWCISHPHDGWKTIELLDEALNDPKSLCTALRNQEIIILPHHRGPMYMFMQSYIRTLIEHQRSLNQYDYVGWEATIRKENEAEIPVIENPKYFILYDRKISVADGKVTPCIMTRNTHLDNMWRAGDLDKQIALMHFYKAREYMAQQFAICASLATPFFYFTGQHGMLICLAGETGSSKSTGIYFAASLWGHPENYCISGLQTDSTYKGRQERGAIHRNLPFMVDEITLLENKEAREIALSASQSGPYISLKNNRSFRDGRGGCKANLTICTSNRSLIQMVNADNSGGQAGMMRVFEIKVDQKSIHTSSEANHVMRQLLKNYGHIGQNFLERCLPHTEEIGEKLIEIRDQLVADIGDRHEERFTVAAAATALLGAKLGSKLGYLPFSYNDMREWLINEQIPAMRNKVKLEREHRKPETILNEYLEEIWPSTFRVNKNSRGMVEILHAPPNVECNARYEIHNAAMFVRTGPFRVYCNKHSYDYNDILRRLHAKGIIISTDAKVCMRKEPPNASGPLPCFIVKLRAAAPVAAPSSGDEFKIIDFPKKKS